jgi:hypothetical protein
VVIARQNRSHWQKCDIRLTGAAVRDMTRRKISWGAARGHDGHRRMDGCEVAVEGEVANVVMAGAEAAGVAAVFVTRQAH